MSEQQDPAAEQDRSKRHLRWLVVILFVLAILGIGSRILFLGSAHLAGGDRLWRLTVGATVKATAQSTGIQIYPPVETPQLRVVQRTLHHPGFRIRNWSEEKDQRRSILAFATTSGQQTITAEFILHLSQTPLPAGEVIKKELTNQQRERFLQDGTNLQLQAPLVVETLQRLSRGQTDREQMIEAIFKYLQLFAVSYGPSELNVPTILANRKATTLDRSLAMVALCRAAGIPARLVTGFRLQEDIDPQPYYWTEVYEDDEWRAYDIQAGYRQSVPHNYVTLRRNGEDIIQVLNGDLVKRDYDLEQEFNHPYLRQFKPKSYLNILDLSRLPVEARNELALLLLLPLGALITALFRHLVGVHSYGVFTPTLLALALVYTDRITTLIIFLVVCALAIGGRSVFPSSMTRVPRLAIIFTLVSIILSLSVSVLDYFDLQPGGKVILLPIIILTSLIDRLYRTIEDKSLHVAMHRLVWTIVIALLCLPVIQFETLGHLLVTYPEAHLITLALFLLISTYKGRQLLHLPLIKLLAEPDIPQTKRKKKKKTPTRTTSSEQTAETDPHAS